MRNYSSYTDIELLSLLSKDNKSAFEMIYARHWEDLYLSAFTVLKNTEASKDIVQEIFIWLWEHRNEVEIKTVRSYLRSAVKYKVANYIRSGNIRESFFGELARFTPPEFYPSVEESLEIKELQELIQQVVFRLPEKCREIFRLSREEQLSNREIAEKLSISQKTVENQMTIAISRLRKTINPAIINVLLLEIIRQF